MRKRESIQPLGLFLFALSLLILFTSQTFVLTSFSSLLTFIGAPISKLTLSLSAFSPMSKKPDEKKLAQIQTNVTNQESNREMQALRDQFEASDGSPSYLLPVRIVGYRGFLPGVREPSSLVIDGGTNEAVTTGQAVVYENNLVGRVIKTTKTLSEVQLLSDSDLTFTAETQTNKSTGVIRGGQERMVFGNVVLSDELEKGDIVVTKGDVAVNGGGFPPNIIVGEIVATEKRQSDLFQLAEVESLINVTELTTVFVYLNK